ncbi:MAG TPA: ankyrin repeat domain-containing protein [Pyrinomonadaceae bacterium]|nr:ankyrin repeat domain-containing protein [Pyrinomonadaceae bacterium]
MLKRLLLVAAAVAVALVAVGAFVMLRGGGQRPAGSQLTRAAERGDAAELRALIAAGADVNERDNGYTPLMFAARSGSDEAVRVLLDAGADPNARACDSNGWTPLIHAIHKRRREAARALVERGADVNARAGACSEQSVETGRTPLMYAAMYDDAKTVSLLLEHGADPRAEEGGSNALTFAVGGAAFGKLADIDHAALNPCPAETVHALLSKEPNLRIRKTVLDRAVTFIIERKCPEVSRLLDARRPSPVASDTQPGAAR